MKLLNTLFEITIYSAVLFAAVTGFKLAFKNKLSPALHFTLWFLVIARLCIPMTIESGFHLFTVEQEKPLVQQQIPEVSAFDAPTPAATREAAPSEALHSEAPAPVQEPLPAADSPKPVFTIASADALIALWVAGMAFRAAALLFGERRLHLAMAHNTLPTDARTRDIYDACCAELGIAHKLPLQSMAGIILACAYGRPKAYDTASRKYHRHAFGSAACIRPSPRAYALQAAGSPACLAAAPAHLRLLVQPHCMAYEAGAYEGHGDSLRQRGYGAAQWH